MNIVKDIIEENAMSGKLKITEKTGGGDTIDTDSPEKSKSRKISESSLDQVDPKNMKITLPLSKIDERSMSSMYKNSHETDSIPRKNKSRTIPGPSVKALKVTQDEYDTEKDNKVSSSVEVSRQEYACVTPHTLLNTPICPE